MRGPRRQTGALSIGRIILIAVLALLVGGAAFVAKQVWGKPSNVDWYFNRVFVSFALESPQMMSSIGIFPRFIGYNDELDDISMEKQLERQAWFREQLALLDEYDREEMTEQQRISTEIFEWFASTQVEGQDFEFHSYPVNQMFGEQSNLPTFMIETHQIKDEATAEDYISRLSKFTWKWGSLVENLEHRESLGIIPPRFVVEKVLKEMREFRDHAPTENPLYTSFLERAEGAGIEQAELDRLSAEVEAAIASDVYTAFDRLITYHENVLPKTTDDAGVWKLPDGDRYYAWLLKQYTTTDLSADEIHEIGLSEVDRIRSEMLAILHSEGYEGDELGPMIQALGEEERFRYPDEEGVKEQILADYQAIIDEIDAGLDPWFNVRPEAGVQVKAIPEFKEDTAPGAYYNAPARDGSRPGIFYANLRAPTELQKFGMRTLAYHEAIPGHHFQIAIAAELEGLPIFRTFGLFTAYTEGWALYSERVAWEAGFQEDPFDNLGRLQAEMFRAVRLVVDTGLHAKRWTREEAIEYMMANTGMPEVEVVSEIERYIVLPGQATSYKIGMNKILEIREDARERLGAAFDIRGFHDVVLKNGAVPLDLLGRIVDDWVEAQLES